MSKQIAPAVRMQFTIAGLLSYFVGVAVYFAMWSTLWASLSALRQEDYNLKMLLVTVLTAWAVLEWLYRVWRLRQAQAVHLAGPLVTLVLAAVVGLLALLVWQLGGGGPPSHVLGFLEGALFCLVYSCCVSAAVSFPAATVMLLYLCMRPLGAEGPRDLSRRSF